MLRMLPKHVERFQEIVALLVDFDFKTGRYNRYRDQEHHWLRKAISVCDPGCLRVTALPLPESDGVYNVTVTYSSERSRFRTSWIHEDGIYQERKTAPPEHPVHGIVCLTDLLRDELPENPVETVHASLSVKS